MKRTPLLFLLCLTLLSLSVFHFQTSSAKNESSNAVPAHESFSAQIPGRVQGTDEAFAKLIIKAEREGSVRIIVGLNTAVLPEGFLPNAQLVKAQREGITQAQDSLVGQLIGFNARSITRFTFIPFMAMELDAAGLAFLQNSPEVSSIAEDLPRPLALAESVPLIGGPAAWASGFSGTGQSVAILDTGVDKTHSFMSGKVVSEACYSTTNTDYTSVCPGGVTESTSPGSGVNCSVSLNSDCAHGTHVAGIAAGKGSSFSGVAKDANVIAIQVFSQPVAGGHLSAFDSNIISGLQRVQQLSGSFNIAAVNLSLGGGPSTTNCDSTDPAMKAAIDNLRSLGIATVIASGNDGSTNGISFPACISSAISVGSTDDGSLGTTVDVVSNFSNSASFLNLLAPGRWINSSVAGGSFQNFSGTSMATPHVAGAWAVLKSKAPSATVDQVLQALTSTGLPVTDSRNGITKPRIKVDAALNALESPPATQTLTVASTNPSSGVSITVSPNDNSGFGSGTTLFSRTYNQNTVVSLTAPLTAGGNNFQKWQRNGVDWSTSITTNVTLDDNYTMTAVYVTSTRTLTVRSNNPSSGVSITVTPNDNTGLGNGTTQLTRTYNANTVVSLTAPATAGGNTFVKWLRNGVDWSTSQTTNVTLDANYTMTAVYFTPPPRTLTVASTNPASGVSITLSPNDNSGLGNGTTQFSRTYNANTVVSLTAPATTGGNVFQKWQRNGVDWSTSQTTNVTLDANYTMTAVYAIVQNVVWTNVVGATASGNSLTKTVVDSWGNAGAVSTQAIAAGDGYVEFTASETNRARMCGLGNTDSSQNYTDIEFAIQLTASDGTNGIWIFESGTFRGNFGTYTAGDKFRVAVEGGVVKYKKNGTVFYTSTVAPSYPLLVDTSLYSNGSTLTNVIISGNLNSNLQNVVWTNMVGATASGNSLTKTALDNWDAGAVSTQAIAAGDGYVEFTASETNRARMCGLGNGDSSQNYTDIEFAIQLTASDGTNGIWIFESGAFRGNFGTYTAGDKFRVEVEGGVVKYKKNGTVFYTSTVVPSYPLLVDTSLYSNGSTLTNVIISGNLSGGG